MCVHPGPSSILNPVKFIRLGKNISDIFILNYNSTSKPYAYEMSRYPRIEKLHCCKGLFRKDNPYFTSFAIFL